MAPRRYCTSQKGFADNPTDSISPGASEKDEELIPLFCLVSCVDSHTEDIEGTKPNLATSTLKEDFQFVNLQQLKKHLKFPSRPLYLDPFRRPLITFPMTQEGRGVNFNVDRKSKINQQILDGFLDPSEAVLAPSIFPHKPYKANKNQKADEEEILYLLQLPDLETECLEHGEVLRTPRFIWYPCKKPKERNLKTLDQTKQKTNDMKKGPGPKYKPKPWLLSRHTDFDLMSQW